MIKYFFAIVACITLLSCNTQVGTEQPAITTFYFIRHAEKNRENPADKNPSLTEKGQLRAKKWSAILSNVSFDAIYSTDYNRTIETASPTAYNNNLDIIKYEPENLNTLKIFKEGYKNILVVGHSNTIPKLVNNLMKEDVYSDIDDNNNGNLYIVTLVNQKVISVNLLTIN